MIKCALIYLILVAISSVKSYNFNKSKSLNIMTQFDNTDIFTGLLLYYDVVEPDMIILKQNNTKDTFSFAYGFKRSQSTAYINLNFPRLPFQYLKKSVCYLVSSYFKFNITSNNVVYFTPELISSISTALNFIKSLDCDIMVYMSESYSLINILNWCKNYAPQLCKYTWFTENVVNSSYYPVYSFPRLLLDDIHKINILLIYIKSIKKKMEGLNISITLSNIHKFIQAQRNVNKHSGSLYITYNADDIDISLFPESPLYYKGKKVGKCDIYSCEITDNNNDDNSNNYKINDINGNENSKAPPPPIEECLCKDIRYCILDDTNKYQCNFHNFTMKSRYNGFDDAYNMTWIIVQYILIGICVVFMIGTFFLRKHRFMVYQNWILDWCIMLGTIIFCCTSLVYIVFVFKKNYSKLYKYAPLQLYFLGFEMVFGAEALILDRVCKRITKRQSSNVVPDGTVIVGGVNYKRGSCISKQQHSIHQSQQIQNQNQTQNQTLNKPSSSANFRNQSSCIDRSKKNVCDEDPTLIPPSTPNDGIMNSPQQQLLLQRLEEQKQQNQEKPAPIDTNTPNAPNTIRIVVSPSQTPPRNATSLTPRSVGVIVDNKNDLSQNQASSSGTGNSSSKDNNNNNNNNNNLPKRKPTNSKQPKVSLSAGQLFLTLETNKKIDKRSSTGTNTPCVDSVMNTPHRTAAADNLDKRLGRKRTVNLSVCKNAPPPTQQIQLTKKEWIIYIVTIFFYIVLCLITFFLCPYEIRVWRMSFIYDLQEDILNGIDPHFTILDGLYVNLYEATSYICFILWVFQVAYFARELIIIFTDGEKLNVYESVLVTSIYLSLICFGCLLAVIMLINVDSRTSGFVLLGLSLVYTIMSLYGTGYPLLSGYINPKKEEKVIDVPGSDIRCVECGYLLDCIFNILYVYLIIDLLVPNRNKDRFKMGCPDAQNTNREMNTARSAIKNTITNLMKSARKDSGNQNTDRRSFKRTSATRRPSRPNESNSGTRNNSVVVPTPLKGRSSTATDRDSRHSDAGIVGGGRKSISDEVQIIKSTPLHPIPENDGNENSKSKISSSRIQVRNSTTPANMAGIESIRVGTNDDNNFRSYNGVNNNNDEPPPSQRNNLYNAIAASTNITGNDFGIESNSTVPVIPKGHIENKVLDGVRLDGSLRVENYSNGSSPILPRDSKRVLLEPLDLDKQKSTKKK